MEVLLKTSLILVCVVSGKPYIVGTKYVPIKMVISEILDMFGSYEETA